MHKRRAMVPVIAYIVFCSRLNAQPPNAYLETGTPPGIAEAEAHLQSLPSNSSAQALACSELAILYQQAREFDRADTLYQCAIRAWEASRPAETAGLIRLLSNLAGLYVNMGQFAKAERICLRAIGLSADGAGIDTSTRARLLLNLAVIYDSRGRYDDAESWYLRCEQLWVERAGPENLEVATVLNNLAMIDLRKGASSAAISRLEQALAIWRKQAGPECGLVAMLTGLGMAYDSAGNMPQAEQSYLEAQRIAGNAPGLSRTVLPRLLSKYAALLRKTKRPREAKNMEAQAQAIQRELDLQKSSNYAIDVADFSSGK